MSSPQLHPDTVEAYQMFCDTSSGGKLWCGMRLSTGEMIAVWGPKHSQNQQAKKVITKQAFDKLFQEKVAKGYRMIDELDANAAMAGPQWQSQTARTTQKTQPTWGSPPPKKPSAPLNDITANVAVPQGAIDYDF
jgi:hypothetical protein